MTIKDAETLAIILSVDLRPLVDQMVNVASSLQTTFGHVWSVEFSDDDGPGGQKATIKVRAKG